MPKKGHSVFLNKPRHSDTATSVGFDILRILVDKVPTDCHLPFLSQDLFLGLANVVVLDTAAHQYQQENSLECFSVGGKLRTSSLGLLVIPPMHDP